MQAAFVQWLRDKGGYINPKIDLFRQSKSGDRGVYAREDIKEGEQLLLVPVQATLHLDVNDITNKDAKIPATCRRQITDFLQQQQPPFSSFLASTIMLMAELANSSASGYGPYFATLPEQTDCLINWTEDEKQMLTGTSLETTGRSIQDIFTTEILPKLQSAPDLFSNNSSSSSSNGLSYAAFRRAADLVQTRAFHMKADNWLTGASQESTDELYLIPAIDMLNHSTDPSKRNTSLALFRGQVEVTLENGDKKQFKDFFSMKAEYNIPAGTQILHTYGDLSDAQLLQTYGFIDAPPAAATAAAAKKSKKKHKKHGSISSSSGGGDDVDKEFSNPHNYVVLPMRVLLDAVQMVAAAARLWSTKKAKKSGLLPADKAEESQLMITAAAAALPDDLLNIVQVLMMTEDEFQQLQQAEQEDDDDEQQQTAAAAGDDDTTAAAAAAAGSSVKSQGLDLGRDLLQGEFGELCATVLLQAVGSCLKRLPEDAAAGAALLAAAAPGSRAWLAAAVAAGEQQQWQRIKKEALLLMLEATQGGEDDDEDDDDDELDSELDSEDQEEEDSEEEDSEEEEAPTAKRKKTQKQQLSSKDKAAAAAAEQKRPASKRKQHNRQTKARVKDSRPHYGDMTGPQEQDIWQSDDSDKVGYSSDEDEAAAAAGGGGGDKSQPSSSGKKTTTSRIRHPPDSSEVHAYEVGGSGAVREVHGHMVGPDEADLIESDDSDKVGYCDADSSGDEQAPAAAAAGKRSRDTNNGGPAATAATERKGSKKSKKGLGYKG